MKTHARALALALLAAGLSTAAQAASYTITFYQGNQAATSAGISDQPGGYCGDGSGAPKGPYNLCSRNYYMCQNVVAKFSQYSGYAISTSSGSRVC